MNRIYLDKLIDFSNSTNKNCYEQFNNKINLEDEIAKIKQNLSLNEKGNFLKYNYIELTSIFPNFEQNENILIYPICFNIEDNIEWFNLLNCLLLILNDDYILESNIIKKKILLMADKMYRKKINISDKLNNEIYNKISELSNINLIIIENYSNINIFQKSTNDNWIICIKYLNEYYPIYNFDDKKFNSKSFFIKYILELTKKQNNLELNKLDNKPTPKTDFINQILKVDNVEYHEFISNEDYTLHISEAIEKKNGKNNNQISSENKKKNKSNKNIFVTHENIDIDQNKKKHDENIDSVFKKSEIINKSRILEIISNVKSTTKLYIMQEYAIELGIEIVAGSTKNGKPKNKKKNELFDEIKKLEIKYN